MKNEVTIRVCDYCKGEVIEVGFGNCDGASICQECGATEAGDKEITITEWEGGKS